MRDSVCVSPHRTSDNRVSLSKRHRAHVTGVPELRARRRGIRRDGSVRLVVIDAFNTRSAAALRARKFPPIHPELVNSPPSPSPISLRKTAGRDPGSASAADSSGPPAIHAARPRRVVAFSNNCRAFVEPNRLWAARCARRRGTCDRHQKEPRIPQASGHTRS